MNDKNEKIKIVAYVRYSSHAQDDGNSVAAQIACISEYAESHNMEVEHWYIDMAKTGRNTKRPEYQRMKQDIENGNVEGKVILVRAIDRMHRNAKNQLVDADWCKKLGVRIISITDGMYNELVNRFVSYMGSNMTPQTLDLKNAAIDHIEVDGGQTTIYFNSGIGIDAATKEYFDNEKDWGTSK